MFFDTFNNFFCFKSQLMEFFLVASEFNLVARELNLVAMDKWQF